MIQVEKLIRQICETLGSANGGVYGLAALATDDAWLALPPDHDRIVLLCTSGDAFRLLDFGNQNE